MNVWMVLTVLVGVLFVLVVSRCVRRIWYVQLLLVVVHQTTGV